jgi:hypothetical protein
MNGTAIMEVQTAIAFFSPTGSAPVPTALTPNDCTFENPCGTAELTQQDINELNEMNTGKTLYLKTGDYTLDPTMDNTLTLNEGQGIEGRTADDKEAAQGNARPVIHGGFVLPSNSFVTNTIILPTTATTLSGRGIQTAVGATDFSISNTEFSTEANPFTGTALLLLGTAQGTIQDSTLFSSFRGIGLQDDAQLTVLSTTINVSGSSSPIGLFVADGSTIDVQDSTINVFGINAQSAVFGVSAQGTDTNGTINIPLSGLVAIPQALCLDYLQVLPLRSA